RQCVEHAADVIAGAILRIARYVVGHLGGRVAARVVGDRAIAPAEMAQLPFPGADVAGELVHEHDRDAGADLLVVELHAVVGGELGHECFLRSRLWPRACARCRSVRRAADKRGARPGRRRSAAAPRSTWRVAPGLSPRAASCWQWSAAARI